MRLLLFQIVVQVISFTPIKIHDTFDTDSEPDIFECLFNEECGIQLGVAPVPQVQDTLRFVLSGQVGKHLGIVRV